MLSQLAVLYRGPTLIGICPPFTGGPNQTRRFPAFVRGSSGGHDTDARCQDKRPGAQHSSRDCARSGLDYTARWLGLPWDDALSPDQKRRIALRGADIANGYGTRAGLEALLESLMPEMPRRFRVIDSTAEFGLAMLGGDVCEGSRLPAILGGLPPTATELGNKAILGRARLPCPDGRATRRGSSVRSASTSRPAPKSTRHGSHGCAHSSIACCRRPATRNCVGWVRPHSAMPSNSTKA